MPPTESSASIREVAGFSFYRMRPPVPRRLAQLFPGLVGFGVALGMSIEAALGVGAWTVFHQGVAGRTGLTIGTITVLTGLVLVVLSSPLREPIGLGTLGNAIVIGPATDITLWAIPDVDALWIRLLLLGAAPLVLGLSSGLYIGAGLGPGPRDSLMTALERRGVKVSIGRLIVEISALTLGWILGGDVGFGTIWMAVTVGWFVQLFLHRWRIDG